MTKIWLVIFFAGFFWSGFEPKDQLTWFLEVSPALIGLFVMIISRQRFPLTRLVYGLILIHSLILMIGGHYTYAEVPLFDWLKQPMEWERNNYDKLGHLAQGFIPAIIVREIFIRKAVLTNLSWLNFIVTCICLAISAFYELLEWLVATLSQDAATAFLGTQGYEWDTQSDMAFALLGAVTALLTLTHVHDRQINDLTNRQPPHFR
ncbi:DUF2238 domain-containing protein [Methylicorpusculum oleiharenae]|uniref:DUF2238 domain-containing protein n=1 Tax=Methylicorpusculum oleiharenae TaxID=1338687 RepID=UPI00135BC868|nr:DUF2238 domain-containing protein [Methylicorpusculum oleiharenae]MCD2453305.1 DUF2238 domain-containing protein [Methylicorpusculum oleiharenae]